MSRRRSLSGRSVVQWPRSIDLRRTSPPLNCRRLGQIPLAGGSRRPAGDTQDRGAGAHRLRAMGAVSGAHGNETPLVGTLFPPFLLSSTHRPPHHPPHPQITAPSRATGHRGGVNIGYFPSAHVAALARDVCRVWQVLHGQMGATWDTVSSLGGAALSSGGRAGRKGEAASCLSCPPVCWQHTRLPTHTRPPAPGQAQLP